VSGEGVSANGERIYYASKQYDWRTEKATTTHYVINVTTAEKKRIQSSRRQGHSAEGQERMVWQAMAKALYAKRRQWQNMEAVLQWAAGCR